VSTPPDAPSIPGYAVESLLGRGAHGSVWLARETDGLQRPVALKVFPPEERASWAREVELTRQVEEVRRRERAAGLVQALGTGEPDGRGYIALEYLEDGTLADLVARDGPLPADRALPLVADVARALDLLHAEGLFHRDVKPQNLLLGRDGRVRLGDFGLSRSLDGTLSAAGSPAFAAPEVIAGRVACGRKVDLYSLGATLAFLLTSEAILPGRPDVFAFERAGVPRPVQDAIVAATALDPDARTASVQAFLEPITQALTEDQETARTESGAPDVPPSGPEGDAMGADHVKTDDLRVEQSRCPYCHDAVALSDPDRRACLSCAAWHHDACWDEQGGCAACELYDGSAAKPATKAQARPAAPPGPGRVSRAAVGSFLCSLAPWALGVAAFEIGAGWGGVVYLFAALVGLVVTVACEVMAFVLGVSARRRIAASGGALVGTGWAMAGIVVAGLNLGLPCLLAPLAMLTLRAGSSQSEASRAQAARERADAPVAAPAAPEPPVSTAGARSLAEAYLRAGGDAPGLLLDDPSDALLADSRTSRLPLAGRPLRRDPELLGATVSGAGGGARADALRAEAFTLIDGGVRGDDVVFYDVTFALEYDVDGDPFRQEVLVSLHPQGGQWRVVPPAPGLTFDVRPGRVEASGEVEVELRRLAVLERTTAHLAREPVSIDLQRPADGFYLALALGVRVDGTPLADLPEDAVASTGPFEVSQAGERLPRPSFWSSYTGGASDDPALLYLWETVGPVERLAPVDVAVTVTLGDGRTETVTFTGVDPTAGGAPEAPAAEVPCPHCGMAMPAAAVTCGVCGQERDE